MRNLKFKTLTSAVILSAMLCSQAEAVVDSGTCGSSYTACHYTLDENGTLTISGNGAIKNNAFVSWGFPNYQSVKNVIIEKGITSIGDQAFRGLTNMKNVSIPKTVTTIGSSSFYGVGLSSVVIPKSVTSIANSAFFNVSLKNVTIEGENVEIGNYDSVGYGLYHNTVNFNVIPDSATEKRLKELAALGYGHGKATYTAYVPPKRTYYTIEEAMQDVTHDNHNRIIFTFK